MLSVVALIVASSTAPAFSYRLFGPPLPKVIAALVAIGTPHDLFGGHSMTRLRALAELNRLPSAAEAAMLWVAVGPWRWGLTASRSAIANHVFLVFALGPMAMIIAALRPAAFVTLVGSVWLSLGPWLLGYATVSASWVNELVSGLLLAVACVKAAGLGRPAISAQTAAGAPMAVPRLPCRS